MYGKIFKSMYDGTLAASWEALVTFQQLIVLADDVGVVDMTPQALSARTGIPIDVIEVGIGVLEATDEFSRTPDLDGRRIERLDDHRPWGWKIVNYAKYRQLASHEHKKAADRKRIAKKRAADSSMSQPVATCRGTSHASQPVADVAHTEVEVDTEVEKTKNVAQTQRAERAFEKFWDKYPERNGRKLNKKKARAAFSKIPDSQWPDVNVALENLVADIEADKTKAKDAFRWLAPDVWPEWLQTVNETGPPLDKDKGRDLVRRALAEDNRELAVEFAEKYGVTDELEAQNAS